jgi:phage shock protein E
MGCLLTLLPALALGEEFQTPAITAEALVARRGTPEELLVVDVRPAGEYKSGHVAGAINIPNDKMEKRMEELGQAKNGVVLYCTLGTRTRLAEQTLLDHAVPNVFHLDGGLGAWRQGGHEIHTGWGP